MEKEKNLNYINSLNKKIKIYRIIILLLCTCGFILLSLFLKRLDINNSGLYLKAVNDESNIHTSINSKSNNTEFYHNASKPLLIDTGEPEYQAYHPKVLNFKEAWNGYKYWMSFSPYPFGNDKYENPYILASNDMVNWVLPEGASNPVEPTPENYEPKKVYNSDPHIVYNDDKKILELYWRYVDDNNNKVIIYRKTSNDGVKWSNKEEILNKDRTKKDFLSPAIIYENNTYKMWYVDRDRTVRYMESEDGKNYKNERVLNLKYPLKNLSSWHLDVIHTKKGYEMIVVAFVDWNDRNSMNLYYFNSKDNMKWNDGITILRPSVKSWDNRGIYRSSFIYENDTYYLFYSGISTNFERGIGLTSGNDISNLKGYVEK